MGIIASITRLDKKYGWSFLGFVLAAIFGALSIYTEFFKETAPRLEFELLSSAPVLDVREKLPELEVLYRSQNIQEQGKTLSILFVRAVNRGTADLLSSHYDNKVPVGLIIDNGTLIRADLAGASNEYLRQAAVVTAISPTAALDPMILEPDEWYMIKLLVLHDVALQPTVSARGKIAGMHSIKVTSSGPETEKGHFWFLAFSGDVWTQLVRAFGYFLAVILTVFIISIPTEWLFDAAVTARRKKHVRAFKSSTKIKIEDSDDFIFAGYVSRGIPYVHKLIYTVADPERLQEHIARSFDKSSMAHAGSGVSCPADAMAMGALREARQNFRTRIAMGIDPLIKYGFIVQSDGKWIPSPARLQVATSFIEFLGRVRSADT